MDSIREFFYFSMSTSTASLACVCRFDFYQSPIGAFSLIRQVLSKLRPCHIVNTFRKTTIVNHLVDRQILNGNYAILINSLSAFLMSKIRAFVCNPFMDTRYNLFSLLSLNRAFFKFREFSLSLCQSLFFFSKESWIFYLVPIRESRKGLKTYINSNGLIRLWQWFRFDFTGKHSIPFACRRTLDSAGFNLPLWLPMKFNLNSAYLGKFKTIISYFIACLRECETIISAVSFKARITRFFTCLDSTKESLKSKINSNSYILQALRMSVIQFRFRLFQIHNRNRLSVIVDRLLFLFPRVFSLLKKVVIHPTTPLKPLIHCASLLTSREKTIFISFKHIDILYLNTLFVNRFFRKDGQFIPNQTEFGLWSSCLLSIKDKLSVAAWCVIERPSSRMELFCWSD